MAACCVTPKRNCILTAGVTRYPTVGMRCSARLGIPSKGFRNLLRGHEALCFSCLCVSVHDGSRLVSGRVVLVQHRILLFILFLYTLKVWDLHGLTLVMVLLHMS